MAGTRIGDLSINDLSSYQPTIYRSIDLSKAESRIGKECPSDFSGRNPRLTYRVQRTRDVPVERSYGNEPVRARKFKTR